MPHNDSIVRYWTDREREQTAIWHFNQVLIRLMGRRDVIRFCFSYTYNLVMLLNYGRPRLYMARASRRVQLSCINDVDDLKLVSRRLYICSLIYLKPTRTQSTKNRKTKLDDILWKKEIKCQIEKLRIIFVESFQKGERKEILFKKATVVGQMLCL